MTAPTPHPPRLRRSALYVPASNTRALDKAPKLGADCIILDLEDAVAPEAKLLARANAVAALEQGMFAGRELVVRVNAFGSPWLADDLSAIVPAGPQAVLFPKIAEAEDVRRAEDALAQAFAGHDLKLWLMVETPAAVLDLPRIAGEALADRARLDCLVMGTNDLARDLRVTSTASRLALLSSLSLTVLAARAHGLDVLDGVYTAFQDKDGFASECRQGRGLGFDGKTLIHPGQIETANLVFSPTADEVAEASAIVEAFSGPESIGKAVAVVNGRMVELLHFEAARRVLAIAAQISSRQSASLSG